MSHSSSAYDVWVLGGGISGAGIAREASLRGLKVLLTDEDDFVSGTSHLSTKLIHGGFRYLEQGQFGLVYHAISERNLMVRSLAPHLVKPLRFIFPFASSDWMSWLWIRMGSWVYDVLAKFGNSFPGRSLFGQSLRQEAPALSQAFTLGIAFGDALTNDARLTLDTLWSSRSLGAEVLNYAKIHHLEKRPDGFLGQLKVLKPDGTWRSISVQAKCVVNATGPWSELTAKHLGLPRYPIIWVKGSHIVLKKPEGFGDSAMICKSPFKDRRLVFVIPWEGVLNVGTTEEPYEGDPRHVVCSVKEAEYLLSIFNAYFPSQKSSLSDIRISYSGIRPIFGQLETDMHKMSRDHKIFVEPEHKAVTVMGGKLTTFRHVSELVVDRVDGLLGRELPSGQDRVRLKQTPVFHSLTSSGQAPWIQKILSAKGVPALPRSVVNHLVGRYGAEAEQVTALMRERPAWANPLYPDLPYTFAELVYLAKHEQVVKLSDLMKRRTSLFFTAEKSGLNKLAEIVSTLARVLGWDLVKQAEEMSGYQEEVSRNRVWANKP
jgi:glycerol-3-phosphate dehydrogenase